MTTDGGNTFQQATRLGPLRFASNASSSDATGFMEVGETVEWYQLKAKGRSSKGVTLNLTALPAINQTVEIYFKGAQRQGRGKRIATVAGGAVDQRNLKALPGTYFIKVSQTPGTVANGEIYAVTLTSVNTGNFFKSASSKSHTASSNKGKDLFF
jgi:hypothetical protein